MSFLLFFPPPSQENLPRRDCFFVSVHNLQSNLYRSVHSVTRAFATDPLPDASTPRGREMVVWQNGGSMGHDRSL